MSGLLWGLGKFSQNQTKQPFTGPLGETWDEPRNHRGSLRIAEHNRLSDSVRVGDEEMKRKAARRGNPGGS